MKSLLERFEEKYIPEPNTGCWLWEAGLMGKGYGHFNGTGAHRFSYELHRGKIPIGMMVCHKCDVRICVNPEHLFLGTGLDNALDMHSKGRGRPPHGSMHYKARLSAEDILKIRSDARSLVAIGADYGIDRQRVWKIKNKWHWKNLVDSG